MQQQVGLGGFLQRGAEGRHQTVRQVADEAHRVGEHHFQTVAQAQTAGERIQRGKELVGGQRPGPCQPVEQRGLAGVGVADERDAQGLAALTGTTAGAPLAVDLLQARAQPTDLVVEHPAVQLELGLAGAATHADAATLALQVRPHPHQARGLVLHARQLHLQLALGAAGTLREDLDDQLGPVGNLHLPEALKVALLDGADGVVEEDQADALGTQLVGDALGRTRAQVERGIRAIAPQHLAQHRLQPGRTRQGVEFIQIVSLQAFSLGGHGQQRSPLGVGRVRVVLAGDVLVLQWEPPSDWNSMARLGTTVEMACL